MWIYRRESGNRLLPVVLVRSVRCRCGRWVVGVYQAYRRFTDGGFDRSKRIQRHQETWSSCDNGYHRQFEVWRAYWTCWGGPGHQQGGGEHRTSPGKPIISLYCLLVFMIIIGFVLTLFIVNKYILFLVLV